MSSQFDYFLVQAQLHKQQKRFWRRWAIFISTVLLLVISYYWFDVKKYKGKIVNAVESNNELKEEVESIKKSVNDIQGDLQEVQKENRESMNETEGSKLNPENDSTSDKLKEFCNNHYTLKFQIPGIDQKDPRPEICNQID